MSYRTNRKTKGTFRVRNPGQMGMAEYGRGMKSVKAYQLIKEKAEKIKSFEHDRSLYVDDGDADQYKVTFGDGRTIEVQFYDYFPQDGGYGEDEEGSNDRSIDVIVEGALEYSDSYNPDSKRDVARAKRELIDAWGPVAKDWLGV